MENLLRLGMAPELILAMHTIENASQATLGLYLGPSDEREHQMLIDRMAFEQKCKILGSSYSIQEAEYTYQNLLTQPHIKYNRQFLSLWMGRFYMLHKRYVEAAGVLSNAPDDLMEWLSKGCKATIPRTAPMSMMAIIWRLSELARAFAGQERYDSAEAMFQLSLSAGQRFMWPDYPTVIQAQQVYSTYLTSQGRGREAKEVEQAIDLGLKMYMLNLDSDS